MKRWIQFLLLMVLVVPLRASALDDKNCGECTRLFLELGRQEQEKKHLEGIYDKNLKMATSSNLGGASARIKLRSNMEILGTMIKDQDSKIMSIHNEINLKCKDCPQSRGE